MKKDAFEKLEIDSYIIKERVGEGAVGAVYRGVRNDDIQDERAFKFISAGNLRKNWKNEINKVTKLSTVNSVIPYHGNGIIWVEEEKHVWISWKFIRGTSLRSIVDSQEITVPLLCSIIENVLTVLHACRELDIQHGDLHSGNVLIENSNPLNIDAGLRRVWITDFGYLTASIGKDMLDDFLGLAIIIRDCINSISRKALNGEDKNKLLKLELDFLRLLKETDHTQGSWVRNPRELLSNVKTIESDNTIDLEEIATNPGDYLAAETIGDRYHVWRSLFVPVFSGSDDILSRNICVMTGLRGCGKTMIFRRLTALYNHHLGPSKVKGSESFIGFYLNARTLAEAFPWLPQDQENKARNQILHFFHVSWSLELGNIILASPVCERKKRRSWMAGRILPILFCWFDLYLKCKYCRAVKEFSSEATQLIKARRRVRLSKLGTFKA